WCGPSRRRPAGSTLRQRSRSRLGASRPPCAPAASAGGPEGAAMESRAIATLIHGTYLVEPATPPWEAPAEGAPLLVGFHGYGENAAIHLAELGRIPGSGRW